jgi:hypothetical protein
MNMSDDSLEAARLAGWNPTDGPPPFQHASPPPIDPALGTNGVAAPAAGDIDFTGGAA